MKPLPLILAFLPLIAFSLLSRLLPHGYIGVAGLVAAVIALIAIATSRPWWPPKILNACSFVLFALIAVLGFTLGKNDDRWLATWGGSGIGLVIGLIILALIPVMPFTEQFARETTPRPSGNRRRSRRSTGCSAPPGARPSARSACPGSPPRPSTGTLPAACQRPCSAW
jgi:hypothetical protein